MTVKNSLAKISFWAKITPEQRSILMSLRRKKGWKRKTKAERLEHGRKLTATRLLKVKKKTNNE